MFSHVIGSFVSNLEKCNMIVFFNQFFGCSPKITICSLTTKFFKIKFHQNPLKNILSLIVMHFVLIINNLHKKYIIMYLNDNELSFFLKQAK